ncbi:MAG: hypothetical protein KC708_21600 [Anaerolineae bacterium]|nr:hypothetical protein [Anaerolineae bacterium]
MAANLPAPVGRNQSECGAEQSTGEARQPSAPIGQPQTVPADQQRQYRPQRKPARLPRPVRVVAAQARNGIAIPHDRLNPTEMGGVGGARFRVDDLP